jgi:hypothetical protein
VAVSYKYGDEPAGSGATDLVGYSAIRDMRQGSVGPQFAGGDCLAI